MNKFKLFTFVLVLVMFTDILQCTVMASNVLQDDEIDLQYALDTVEAVKSILKELQNDGQIKRFYDSAREHAKRWVQRKILQMSAAANECIWTEKLQIVRLKAKSSNLKFSFMYLM